MGKKPFTGSTMRNTLYEYKWSALSKKRGGPIRGMKEMILAEDPETGAYSRLVHHDPEFKSPKPVKHKFWEEVFIIDGDLIDYNSKKTYTKGCYALRQAGIEHGPFGSDKGCILFETTWYDRDWYEKNKKIISLSGDK